MANEDRFKIVCVNTNVHSETIEHDMITALIRDMGSNGYFETNNRPEFNLDGSICGSKRDVDILLKAINVATKKFGLMIEDVNRQLR